MRTPSESEFANFLIGTKVRVVLVQHHPLLSVAIADLVRRSGDLVLLDTVDDGEVAASVASREKADVALIDFTLPDRAAPRAAQMVRAAVPGVAVVFHNGDDCETAMLDAIDAGAAAYLTRAASGEQLVEAVRRAARGDVLMPVELLSKSIARRRKVAADAAEHERRIADFTPRELEILQMLSEGLDSADIAARLGIGQHTVQWHVGNLLQKLQVHTQLHAVIEAVRQGLIDL